MTDLAFPALGLFAASGLNELASTSSSTTIAIVGSAIAGFAGALLQTWHERRERFRELMLEAAADAAKALESAVAATRVAVNEVEGLMIGEISGGSATEAARKARASIDAAGDIAGRVDLLFGLGAGDALREARKFLRWAIEAAGPSPPEVDSAYGSLAKAEEAYRQFVTEARAAAEAYGGARWRQWFPRPRRAGDS